MPKLKPTGYWTFNCSPGEWKIEEFLNDEVINDTYKITEAYKEDFSKGQLGVLGSHMISGVTKY